MTDENRDLKTRLRAIKIIKNCKKMGNNSLLTSVTDGKRIRKKMNDVKRDFLCNETGCNKAYGSNNALNQHIQFKHTKCLNLSGNISRLDKCSNLMIDLKPSESDARSDLLTDHSRDDHSRIDFEFESVAK